MIVKVKNGKESWSYFECSVIHSKYGLLKHTTEWSDAIILFEDEYSVKNNNKNVTILNLEIKEGHLRTIITDRVCYILNDEGKTVDKI